MEATLPDYCDSIQKEIKGIDTALLKLPYNAMEFVNTKMN